jgi:hypothetical protein
LRRYAADIRSDPQLARVFEVAHGKRALHTALAQVYGGARAYRFLGRNELNVDRGRALHVVYSAHPSPPRLIG